MPTIVLTFNYPEAPLPQYKFGDQVAVTEECAPTNWLTGRIIGLTLDESYEPHWYYSVKLDAPSGLTEEYLEDDLVPDKEIPVLQAEWNEGEAAWVRESNQVALEQPPVPKFQIGILVKFTKATGCKLLGESAQIIDSRYVSSDDWSGWVYQLTNEHLSEPIEIGEYLLEIHSISKVVGHQVFP